MGDLLRLHDSTCLVVIRLLLRLAVLVDDHRRSLPKRLRRWRGSVRRLYRAWLVRHGLAKPWPFARRRHRPWNRTSDAHEAEVVRLHVEQPHLGAGQLRALAARVLGLRAARETIRQILIRRRALVADVEATRKKKPRRIRVTGSRQLWGADLTLVWVLGLLPVWILGVVDYHGSRLVAFERLPLWPTAAQLAFALADAVARHGAPARLLTDRAPIFGAAVVEDMLAKHDTRHVLILPNHCWTNGRIERVFRTFKETIFRHLHLWLFKSHSQVDRFCEDFLQFYNRDRPHSAFASRTPDEVFFGRGSPDAAKGRVSYFDDRLHWYRFG